MSHRSAVVFLTAFLGFLVVVATAKATLDAIREPHVGDGHRRVVGEGQIRFDGRGPEAWALKWRRERRAVRNLAVVVRRQRRQLARLRAPSRSTQSASTASSVPAVICVVFGPYCSQAQQVARCESRFSVWARNGQYENIFQMGYVERRTYGWHTVGSSPWLAARAAYRYFVASGSDWSPWQCKP